MQAVGCGSSGRMQLFCLPHAGGNSYFYRFLGAALPSYLEVVPIEYSGHGTRMGEPLLNDAASMVSDVSCEITSRRNKAPWALFGYSMGAQLAYLVASFMADAGDGPIHVVAAASDPPQFANRNPGLPWSTRAGMREVLKEYGGMSSDTLACEELLDLVEPIIANDFSLKGLGASKSSCRRLDANLTALFSVRETSASRMSQWSCCTSRNFSLYSFEGSHFFITEHKREFLAVVSRELAQSAALGDVRTYQDDNLLAFEVSSLETVGRCRAARAAQRPRTQFETSLGSDRCLARYSQSAEVTCH